ncbi:hypothetical protein Cadr_000027780 [Camelus dromedarius]|uniref:Uncharacterized protein n=1 Tax=Camelus dromedarius TaxID=9838 RepID=A0A5N4CBE9_CAMDR|nr:hypothetical protein Cadr_000027780 [Camelus dromedarius]
MLMTCSGLGTHISAGRKQSPVYLPLPPHIPGFLNTSWASRASSSLSGLPALHAIMNSSASSWWWWPG